MTTRKQSARMNWLLSVAAIATLIAPATEGRAGSARPKAERGEAYEITVEKVMSQRGSNGSTASSTDRDIFVERVVGVRQDGLEVEYDLPRAATSQDRSRSWQFPARVFKAPRTPMRLLNGPQLEARVDGWLKAGGMTRAACGQWIFAWNAFRIDCDPQSVIGALELIDLDAVDLRDGAVLRDPTARGPAPLKVRTTGASGATFIAELTVDADVIRRRRAETDVIVAQLAKRPLSLDAALRERAKDQISGTIAITFDLGPDGRARRRTKVTRLETMRPDGVRETQTTTETVERRRVS